MLYKTEWKNLEFPEQLGKRKARRSQEGWGWTVGRRTLRYCGPLGLLGRTPSLSDESERNSSLCTVLATM